MERKKQLKLKRIGSNIPKLFINNNLEDDYERKSQMAVRQQAHRAAKEMNTDNKFQDRAL